MILKKIAHKVAQAFRLAQAADKKLSTGIAAALDAKAEQLREYEKRFEPEPPKPDPLLEARTSLAQAGFSAAAVMQYPWFKEKRKNDISHKYNWTQTEVSQMKMLRKQGFTIREIAEKMNRSESSIKYKLYGREKSDGRS